MTKTSAKDMTLRDRSSDMTRQLILDAAIELLERSAPVHEVTVRAIAHQGNMSERTVFRYFSSRDELLDSVTAEASRRLGLPGPPQDIAELESAPERLYRAFESHTSLTKALLHSDLFHRMASQAATRRWGAVARLIDCHAPDVTAYERKIAAANIYYYLTGSTWHYHRFQLGFSLEETIDCARAVIFRTLQALAARESASAVPRNGVERG